MKFLMQWLISHWLFGLTLFFAAGAPALTGGETAASGGEESAGAGAADATTDDLGLGYGDDAPDDAAAIEEPALEQKPAVTEDKDEPGVAEFKGLASSRLRALTKEAPELAQIFQKYPQLQAKFESTLRRDAAYRDAFPTVAEANQMRERFPNGLADVQALEADVQEVEALDKDFYTRDQDGSYSGHPKLLNNMFQDDREATISLFRNMPKEWARLDPDSYNEVMGRVVGATLANAGIADYLGELIDAAKEAKQDALAGGLTKIMNWAQGFGKEKPKPSADEERLNRDRQTFNREKDERTKEEGQRFNASFISQSRKLQGDLIKAHPAVKKLMAAQNVSDSKKTEIVEQVRKEIEKLLGKSPSFMRKLKPAYESRNLEETMQLQKAAWSQQWLLNRMVRSVFNKEVPQMVSSNRAAAQKRGNAAPVKPNAAGDKNAKPKGPRQIGGRWYREDGTPFTTAEVISGKHLNP